MIDATKYIYIILDNKPVLIVGFDSPPRGTCRTLVRESQATQSGHYFLKEQVTSIIIDNTDNAYLQGTTMRSVTFIW